MLRSLVLSKPYRCYNQPHIKTKFRNIVQSTRPSIKENRRKHFDSATSIRSVLQGNDVLGNPISHTWTLRNSVSDPVRLLSKSSQKSRLVLAGLFRHKSSDPTLSKSRTLHLKFYKTSSRLHPNVLYSTRLEQNVYLARAMVESEIFSRLVSDHCFTSIYMSYFFE